MTTRRRDFLVLGATATLGMACGGPESSETITPEAASTAPEPTPTVALKTTAAADPLGTVRTRQAVQALTQPQLDAYLAAYGALLAKGWLARLNLEHTRCLVHDMHHAMPTNNDPGGMPLRMNRVPGHGNSRGAVRFLPWHRLFLNTFEHLLNVAYADLPKKSGWPTSVAVPYWDWSNPRIPTALWKWTPPQGTEDRRWAVPPFSGGHGGSGSAPLGGWLAQGHPGRVGTGSGRKHIEHLVAFPNGEIARGNVPMVAGSRLPRARRIRRLINTNRAFIWMTKRLEWRPYGYIGRRWKLNAAGTADEATLSPSEQKEIQQLFARLDEKLAAQGAAVEKSTGPRPAPSTEEELDETIDDMTDDEVAYLQEVISEQEAEALQEEPGTQKSVDSMWVPMAGGLPIQAGPHSAAHLLGGRGRVNGIARYAGSLVYYHETCFDPLFWMLHAQVDRIWWTRQQRDEERLWGELEDLDFGTPFRRIVGWTHHDLDVKGADGKSLKEGDDFRSDRYPSYASTFSKVGDYEAEELAKMFVGKTPYDRAWDKS